MKIGIIFCAWNAADMLERSLRPWIEAKQARLAGHQFTLCAVSVPFVDFNARASDHTLSVLGLHAHGGDVDHVIVRGKPMQETEARGTALHWLLLEGADLIWQVDADEFYTLGEIERILAFVEKNPLIPWFRGSLKNLVFDEGHWLAEPFCPPRIHRVCINERGATEIVAESFWDDNNIRYRFQIDDAQLPHLTIPKAVAWTKHATWLNNERSRQKIAYQLKRWGGCSFRWDETTGLAFDEEYYRSRGLALPELCSE